MAFLTVIIGIISDLIRTNRMLIEDTLEHTKKMRFGKGERLSTDGVFGSTVAALGDDGASASSPSAAGLARSSEYVAAERNSHSTWGPSRPRALTADERPIHNLSFTRTERWAVPRTVVGADQGVL